MIILQDVDLKLVSDTLFGDQSKFRVTHIYVLYHDLDSNPGLVFGGWNVGQNKVVLPSNNRS